MTTLRCMCAPLMSALVMVLAAPALAGSQQPPIKASNPAVVAPPVWSRTLKMPDGRTFVSDGGLSVEATLAKLATLPSVVIPPENSKILAGRLKDPFDKEVRLGDLQTGPFKNSFATADGIALNGNYVNFLRDILPARARLRTKGKTDPVVIVIDGEAVGIMMPLAPAR
jgi:hypothetical protein